LRPGVLRGTLTMKFEHLYWPEHDRHVYTLTVDGSDKAKADLTQFDRLVINDCKPDDRPISDKLLGLETLVRAIERGCSCNDGNPA
jgi:hypothetical protein